MGGGVYMQALFVHDHKFIYSNGNYYTSGGLPDAVLTRYVNAFDELMVMARFVTNTNPTDGNIISNPHINFINKNINSQNTLKDAVKHADVVIVRMPSILAVKAAYFARRMKKKICVEVVGDPFMSYFYYGGLKGKIAAVVMTYFQKRIVRKSEYVIYVSRFFLQNKYKSKGMSIACPDVIFEKPDIHVLENRLRKIDNFSKIRPIVGLVGSLNVNYRGHDKLIEAAGLLKKKGIFIQLAFLGSGETENWSTLAKKYNVDNQIDFCGSLSSGKPVLNWLDTIDLLVMPAKTETLGRTVIEAMSRGCPVLGTIETAMCEQIGSDCLFHVNDTTALANMIEKMINDKEYMKLCAYENYWRSFKYANERTDRIRNDFFMSIRKDCQGVS